MDINDKIETMTHDELKAATRELRDAIQEHASIYTGRVTIALRAFEPTPLDKLKEFLKTEGWEVTQDTIGKKPAAGVFERQGWQHFYPPGATP